MRFNYQKVDELHRTDPEKEWSVTEIAKAAGVTRQTIYNIEARALRKLREAIEDREKRNVLK